jgi:UDPglucose--hexose-1-phosphate uridylyltransferase
VSLQKHSHSRRNLLTGDWVLVSPHRTERPWQGQIEATDSVDEPVYDPRCYLCPGNHRANNETNPSYVGPYIFDNDFAALSVESEVESSASPLFNARTESGRCRVVCYTERHDLRLATMAVKEIETALHALTADFVELDKDESIGYVQVFENRGRMMGCSNPHPHAQIWATENLPHEPAKEFAQQAAWWEDSGSPLLADYRVAEIEDGSRIVHQNDHFVVLVPYWAVWPFETIVIPWRNFSSFDEMSAEEIGGLADILKSTLSVYDRLFDVPAPYSMGFHPRPSDGKPHPEWIFHGHIYPPLLRSATVRKHLVGFEMLAMPQRDLTPEAAAKRLRHYLD